MAVETKIGHRWVGVEKFMDEENSGPAPKRSGSSITEVGLNRRTAAGPAAQILNDMDGDTVVRWRCCATNAEGMALEMTAVITRGSEVTVERFGEIMVRGRTKVATAIVADWDLKRVTGHFLAGIQTGLQEIIYCTD